MGRRSVRTRTIGFVYLDYPFGQEPIEILRTLAEREGFELGALPGAAARQRTRPSAWSKVRRDRPDYVISWLLAGGHVVAAREMRRNRFPIDRYLSVNWMNEVDITNIGAEEATGILRGTNVAGGQEVPIVRTMLETYYANGEGSGPESLVRDVYYNTGLAIYSARFRGRAYRDCRKWLAASPRKPCRPAYESISENFDGDGLMAPGHRHRRTTTAAAAGPASNSGTASTWVPLTDWSADYLDVVWEVIQAQLRRRSPSIKSIEQA